MSYSSSQSDLKNAQAEKIAAGIHVALDVRVLAFYPDSLRVDVQPLNKDYVDGIYTSAAPLLNVPVVCLGAGSFLIRPWYKRGDVGVVVIGDTDADLILASGEEAEPNTNRSHSLEDARFIGGMFPDGKAPADLPADALVLLAGSNQIALSASGIAITGNVTISGKLSAGGIEMTTHRHGGVESGTGTTGGPQ